MQLLGSICCACQEAQALGQKGKKIGLVISLQSCNLAFDKQAEGIQHAIGSAEQLCLSNILILCSGKAMQLQWIPSKTDDEKVIDCSSSPRARTEDETGSSLGR